MSIFFIPLFSIITTHIMIQPFHRRPR